MPPFEVSLPAEETLSHAFSAAHLIYATEENGHSIVWKKDVSSPSAEEEHIFEFDEASSYYQEETLPNVALSAEGTRLAYVDPGGIGIFDLETKSSRILADSLPQTGEKPVGEFGGACCFVHFSYPLWSSDGRLISVQLTQYEGVSSGIVDTSDGSACVPKWQNGRLSGMVVAWSPSGHRMVAHSADNDSSYSGLYLSDEDDPCSGDDISWVYSGQDTWNTFHEGAWSPDERLFAFSDTLAIKTGREKAMLAILDVDGLSSTLIDNEEENRYPIFSPDGRLVYYIKSSSDGVSLWSYSLEEKQRAEVARLPDGHRGYQPLFWTSEGFLALLSYESSDQCHYQSCKNRLIVLDLNAGNVIYASATRDFTKFLALAE